MLNELKEMLGIEPDDLSLDDRLDWILESVEMRLKLRLGGIDPPEELRHIIIEVAIVRYNRIGSEGLSSHTVQGETQNFQDSDFDGYEDEIQDWLENQKETGKGKVRFL